MKRTGVRISLIACLAMVSLQATGAHLHVDTADHLGTTHHDAHFEHSMFTSDPGGEHGGHLDVSFQDYAPKFSKADTCVVANSGFEIKVIIADVRWFTPVSKAPPQRNYRHRPPLRAPPANS